MVYSFAPREFSHMVSDKLIGLPYVEEAVPGVPVRDPLTGTNCWGFVRYLFKITGTELPADAHEAIKLFRHVKQPQYRDLIIIDQALFLGGELHVGFMETHDRMIHCASDGVVRVPLDFLVKVYSFRRLKI